MTAPEPSIRVNVDLTNPGQFFACCGLLELANRLWSEAEGWFDESASLFLIHLPRGQGELHSLLLKALIQANLTNTMSDAQLRRREELSLMTKKQRNADPSLEAEKKILDALWRESPIMIHEPFNLRLDWFINDRSGGDTFKTWAGQQSVMDIAQGMKTPIGAVNWERIPPEDWLYESTSSESPPFYFDSALGGLGSDRDVGFSFDPLRDIVRVRTRPLIEFAAFVGLQRFRPARVEKENRYHYSLWFDHLFPEVAAAAACGLAQYQRERGYEFRLMYRTKYLKSFLPATPIQRRG